MALESLHDRVFSEKSDVVRKCAQLSDNILFKYASNLLVVIWSDILGGV